MPLPHLNWRIGQAELDSLSNLMVNLEAGFAEQGIGAIRCSSWIHQGSGAINRQMIDYNHPMGCTRMSSAEEYGVVDEDCRLYSTKNLYIAGSSIFSTGSIYNPTLTILAFSIRLADHLRSNTTFSLKIVPTPTITSIRSNLSRCGRQATKLRSAVGTSRRCLHCREAQRASE